MPNAVCSMATLKCSCGVSPSILNVLPVNRCISNFPLANIADNKPVINIAPFGMCTASAPPVPCMPVTTAPWIPGSPQVLIGGMPALSDNCKLVCGRGGMIEIVNAGQTGITVG